MTMRTPNLLVSAAHYERQILKCRTATARNQPAQALMSAVQDLIGKGRVSSTLRIS